MMYGYDNGFTCGGGQGMFGYGSFWHMIIPVILIGIIIYAAVKLLSSNNDHNNNNYHDDSLSILNKKFVNGELSEEEYIRRKKIIKSK